MADTNINKDKTSTDKMGQSENRKPEQGNIGGDRNREQGGRDQERTDKERMDKESMNKERSDKERTGEQGREKSAIGGSESRSPSGSQGTSGSQGKTGQSGEFDKNKGRNEPTSR